MTRAAAALAFVALAAVIHCDAADDADDSPAVTLDTAGGDTWRFERTVTGRFVPGACNTIVVQSPAGEARALVHGNRFTAHVRLHSGPNAIRAACRRPGAGVIHSAPQIWTVREDDRPRAWTRTVVSNGVVRLDAGATQPAAGVAAPLASYEWRADPRNPAPLALASGKQVELRSPVVDGEYRVTLHVTDELGRSDESTTLFRVSHGAPLEVDLENTPADWVDNAVVYGAAPTLLTPVGFAGVARRLDAIAALGANVLWLTPVTSAPPGDFGYAVTDHFQVRDTFGSAAELRSLVESAHAHGLKVLLDFVTNHLSAAHPYYQDAERRGGASPYYSWFERDSAGKVVHYFDWTNLENLNYDDPDVRAYMIAACSYWVRKYHVDGFRMDAAWAIRERAPEMWPRLRRELKRIDPDIALLAEASALDPYYRSHGFDAAYDWAGKLGEWAWQSAYADGKSPPDLPALRAALERSDRAVPADAGFVILRFLDNNDTGERFITRHGIEQTRTAAALLFTLPGIPLIFAGEEVGAAFDPYRGGPPIVWRDADGLEPLYASLVKLRQDVPVLRSGSIRLLSTDHDDTVLAYDRESFDASMDAADNAVMIINFGGGPVELRLHPTSNGGLDTLLAGSEWLVEDLLTHASFDLPADASTLPLAAHTALLLRPLPPGAASPSRARPSLPK